MDNAHICQLHYKVAYGSIMKGQISTNQYMLSLKSWIKSPTSSNVGRDTVGVLHQCLEWYSKYGSSCLALPRKMVTICVWLKSQIMERYSENLQVNSSLINWVYYSQGNSKQHLQIWQVISIQEACYDVGDLNVRRGYTCWKQRELGTLFHCQATFKSKNLTEQIFRILP